MSRPEPFPRRATGLALTAALVSLLSLSCPFLSSCSSVGTASAARPAPDAGDGPESWLGDVRLALRELPRRHADLYALMPKAEYERRSAELLGYASAPGRTRDEATLALSVLVASLGDGHTLVRVGPGTTLPLSLYRFDEGYIALAAPEDRPELLGARVLSICGRPMDEVEAIVAPAVSHDNDMALAGQLPYRLTLPFFLRGLGVAERDAASFPVTFALADGAEVAVELWPESVATVESAIAAYRPASPGLMAALAPEGAGYWFARVPGTDLLYLAYDACREDPGRPLGAFASALAAELDSGGYRAVVVDLRRNGGGASSLFWPVEKALAERSAAVAGERGVKVYAAIGRRTFSSAVLNAIELRAGRSWAGIKAAGAVYVGEPSGGKPNHYGEVKTLRLDGLGATLCYSTKLFTSWPGMDDDALYPDIPVPVRFSDYAAGRDAVIDAVLADMRG